MTSPISILRGILPAIGGTLLLACGPALAAPAILVVFATDISQLMTYGRFDPSLGFLTGPRVTLTPTVNALPAIRMPNPQTPASGGAVAINDVLREGGADSSTIFERLHRRVPLCIGNAAQGCGDSIDFADLPIPRRIALSLPGDLPPPILIGAAHSTADGERQAESYLCPIHVPATFSCATATNPAPVNASIAETLDERAPAPASAARDEDDDALLGIGLLVGGIATTVLGTGLVVHRAASRGRRRHARHF